MSESSGYPEPEELVAARIIVVANLKPRRMKFGLSEGMILAGSGQKGMGLAMFDRELMPAGICLILQGLFFSHNTDIEFFCFIT